MLDGARGGRRRRRLRDEQLDVVPGGVRRADRRHGRAGDGRPDRVVAARDRALPPRPRAVDPARADRRGERAGSRAGGRRVPGDPRRRRRRADPRRRHRGHRRRQRLGGGRPTGCRRRRARPADRLPAAWRSPPTASGPGARFIATNRDPVYPTERALRPGAGSIVAAVEAASGVTPDLDRQARAVPARGGGAGGRARAGRGDRDRRRPRDRHRGGRRRRRAEHPDADRASRPARRSTRCRPTGARRRSPPTRPSSRRSWSASRSDLRARAPRRGCSESDAGGGEFRFPRPVEIGFRNRQAGRRARQAAGGGRPE